MKVTNDFKKTEEGEREEWGGGEGEVNVFLTVPTKRCCSRMPIEGTRDTLVSEGTDGTEVQMLM